MRLKTFTAPSMAEAMDAIRDELGDLAIIVSEQTIPKTGQVWVTAAINPEDEPQGSLQSPADGIDAVRRALNSHGVPLGLTDRLTDAMHDGGGSDPEQLLAGALSSQLGFAPIGEGLRRAVILTGPPGGGKTIVAAKLAARERLAGRTASLATTDTKRAGGVAQLSVFTDILKSKLDVADSRSALAMVMKGNAKSRPTLIDTQGVNPFDPAALGEVARLAEVADAKPVLVLAAGGDAQETAEISAAFAGIGVKRIITTRIDCARRMGGLLAAAAAPLAFAEFSLTPTIGDGLEPAAPVLLAKLMLKDPGRPTHNTAATVAPKKVAL
ncbi:MAG: hypothetical protein O7I42_21165 [Alphaproteobacteria bacterium]|nr:hypothetical protein [Alphaproteobacteria bacterium]